MRYFFYTLFIVLFFYPKIIFSQEYSFKEYSLDQGLQQAQINCIEQDSRGLIWVGNQLGIDRFNGSKFVSYNTKKNYSVSNIHESKDGLLWFFTYQGIIKFDGVERKRILGDKNQLDKVSYFEVVECKDKMWVFTIKDLKNNLFYYQNEKFVDFAKEYHFDQKIQGILQLKNKNLLIKTANGLYEFDGNKAFISHYQSIIDKYEIELNVSFVDTKGRLWMHSFKENSELYILENNSIKEVHFGIKGIGNHFSAILEDSNENFWVSFYGVGIFMLDKELKKQLFLNNTNGLINQNISTIFEDKSHNIWFASIGSGLIKFDGDLFQKYSTYNGLDNNIVWSILQDGENTWIGTDGSHYTSGLCKLDKNGVVVEIPQSKIKIKYIADIEKLQDGNLLLASTLGLFLYNGQEIISANKKYKIPNSIKINSITKAPNGDLWLGTNGKGALRYRDGNVELFTEKSHKLASNYIKDIGIDKKGNVWFSTLYGINKWEGNKMSHFFHDLYIGQILIDEDTIWFTTFSGIFRYQNGKFDSFTKKDGLNTNSIYAIIKSKEGDIWVNTQFGISKLSFSKNKLLKVSNYGVADGYTGTEGNSKAIYEDKNGDLWFGSVTGVTKLDPTKLKEKVPPTSNIFMTYLFHDNIDWTSPKYMKMHKGRIPWTFLQKDLILPSYENHITLIFEAIDYDTPEDLLYQYKLEGVDQQWSPLSKKTEAVYPLLQPGSYTFKVRTCYKAGACSSNFSTYSFVISQPFWKTLWFAVLLVLLVILTMFLIFRWKISSEKKKKVKLQEAVNKASKELLAQNQQIKQREQELEKLNSTKDKFFSILAHDIKGPVNSLKGFLNIMTNHVDSMTIDEIQLMSSKLNKSVNNLSELLSNLLSWSRSQMGAMEIQPQNIDLHEIAKSNAQLLDISASNKNITIHNNIEKGLMTFADYNTITTVIRNLVSNAIKFTNSGGRIEINAVVKNDSVLVSIKDNGQGVSQAIQSQLFKLDKKVTTKGTANEAGTGLGLILCKEFVENNGGNIWVESELKKGSTFFFTLPLARFEIKL